MHDQAVYNTNRRAFVGCLGLIGAASSAQPILPSASTALRTEEEALFKCKPYLQALANDSVVVRWITSVPAHSWVEYGKGPEHLNDTAKQIEEGMVQVDNTLHAIQLQGLEPGTTYYYRVVSEAVANLTRKEIAFGEKACSEVFSFATKTDGTGQVEFVVFNDVHERPETFSHLMQFCGTGKKDFAILNGDMFNSVRDENEIVTCLLDPMAELFASGVPFYFVRGNHETWGAKSRQLPDYFDGKDQTFYYSFTYGPLACLVLDSGETKPDEDPANGGIVDFDAYRTAQGKWLAQEVQKEAFKEARFKVVFVHIPPNDYSAKDTHASIQYMQTWGPVLNDAKIDLMLCGHTHKHGIHPAIPGKHDYPIVIGGGKNDGSRTIIDVIVDNESLRLNMKDDAGKLVGDLVLHPRRMVFSGR